MLDKSQLLKGTLEGCILAIIGDEENYGYKITEQLNKAGLSDLNEGSVYPVLIRLEKKGLVETEKKQSPLGPTRKYFRISSRGKKYLREFKTLWEELSSVVNEIVSKGESNEF